MGLGVRPAPALRGPTPASRRPPVKRAALLPSLVTLANAFCGVLALSRAVDAVIYDGDDPAVFYGKMETACMLVFLGMVFDVLDGAVARMTRGFSDFGAHLDSFADALTFGVTPAILAKVVLEHEGELSGYTASPRIGFLAAAAFALMAILRLVRYDVEPSEENKHVESRGVFRGLPTPAAAGAVASTIWLYLILRQPDLELDAGTPTPFSGVMTWMEVRDWGFFLDLTPLALVLLLPVLGFLMVSRVRYSHGMRYLLRARHRFMALVWFVFGVFLFFLAPVPILFVLFNGFVVVGFVRPLLTKSRPPKTEERPASETARRGDT